MRRNQARAISVALAVLGAAMALQSCGWPGSPAPAPPAAVVAGPAAAPATEAAAATPTPATAVAATSKPAVPKKTAQQIARSQPLADGTPCTVTAKACVDLDSQRAWLLDGTGTIVRGPVNVATGSKTEPTPPGYDLRVHRKNQDHVSNESFTNGVPDAMPYSVFFDAGGIAFHEGDPENPSGGCVHLAGDDARAWFAHLKIGDQVQVVNASQVLTARGTTYDGPMYGFGGVRAWEAEHGDDED